MKKTSTSLFLIVLLSSIAVAKPSIGISQAEYGKDWPFTFEEASLWCMGNQAIAVFNFEDNKMYPLNGQAKMQAKNLALEPSIDKVWKKNKDGTRPSLGKLINQGLELCD